jgi:class 3 adenylate cyclase
MANASDRRLAAILFTDIVGYSALMAADEERGLRVRERHRAVVIPLVERHRGEPIEVRGDECL